MERVVLDVSCSFPSVAHGSDVAPLVANPEQTRPRTEWQHMWQGLSRSPWWT